MPESTYQLSTYDYELPEAYIAQHPVTPRDHCKLLLLNRKTDQMQHVIFYEIIQYLQPQDVLVINETYVFPARLIGHKQTGAQIEVLLLEQLTANQWKALVRPARRFKTGNVVNFGINQLEAQVVQVLADGARIIQVNPGGEAFFEIVEAIGHVPLPPYIRRPDTARDQVDYQTVYARRRGSVAAPTAGMHFTNELLTQIQKKGIQLVPITLHIGLDTFRPVSSEDIRQHQMHSEYYQVSAESAQRINQARRNGGRVIAVGTTSVRTLETVASHQGEVTPGGGWSQLFIYPGYQYKVVDAIITNFHLPKSSLLMLIAAFTSLPTLKSAYQEAIFQNYRFYSYGDAMFIF